MLELTITDLFREHRYLLDSEQVGKDEKKMIQKIVADLPEKFRIPIHLYYSADLSIQEIAEILKIPEGTVKSRLNKARQLLKKELEEIGYDR